VEAEIKTICKDCCFYQNRECELGVYSKLKTLKYPNVSVETNSDGDKEILNHVCVYCRPKEWAKKYEGEDLYLTARKEVTLKTTLLLYIPPTIEEDVLKQQIALRWTEIGNMFLQPSTVVFINNSSFRMSDVYRWCIPPNQSEDSFSWSVENITLSEEDRTRENCIDQAFLRVKTPFFMVSDLTQSLERDFLSNVDSALNDSLKKFIAIVDDGFLFVQTQIFKTLGKNFYKPIEKKLEELCNDQNCAYLIIARDANKVLKIITNNDENKE
jgi:ribosomal protein L32